jgi:hypothetical protein
VSTRNLNSPESKRARHFKNERLTPSGQIFLDLSGEVHPGYTDPLQAEAFISGRFLIPWNLKNEFSIKLGILFNEYRI